MSPRLEVPPAVDLVKVGKGNAWHIEAARTGSEENLWTVTTVCGIVGVAAGAETGVDARAVNHRGAVVCANCRAGGSVLARKPIETKESTMAAAAPEKKKPAAKPDGNGAPVTAAALKAAIAKAEKAIASQPARTEVDLTPAKADKAFKLGKSIAADRYLLKRAEAGKTSADTVASMLARIEKRVAERNAIRKGK